MSKKHDMQTVAVNENPLPERLTDGESDMVEFFETLEEFMTTPYVQLTALAQNGTPFTIVKTHTRIGKHMQTGVEIPQILYLLEMEGDIEYKNKLRETRSFKEGDRAVLAFQENKLRKSIFNRITQTIKDKGPIHHMALREVRPSRMAAAQGKGPSVTFCHSSQWKSLWDGNVNNTEEGTEDS